MRFDAVDKTLHVDSRIGDFTALISTATGYGTVTLKGMEVKLNVVSGTIPVKKLNLSGKETPFTG
jgi:hypothetical protein